MTNTTNDLGETFPAGTAAHRIEQSIRALTAGFRYRLLELESNLDAGVALRAEASVNAISLRLQSLVSALSDAAPLLNSQGIKVEGRDIEQEDRAVLMLLGTLKELAEDLNSTSPCYTDYEFNVQQGRNYAGDQLSDELKSWDAVRAFRGRGPR